MLKPTEQEMLWVNSWNDLYELLKQNERLILVDSEWVRISIEDAQGMIQDHAYKSQQVHFEQAWVAGKPALRLSFSEVLERRPQVSPLHNAGN